MRSSGGVNPADSFLVHGDELPELTDEQWTVLTEIGKAGGGVAGDALSRETLGHLPHVQVIAPAGPGRVEITGIVHPPACQGGGAQAGDIVTAAAAVRAGGAVEVPAGPGREPRRGRRPAARWGRLSPSGPVAGLPFPAFPRRCPMPPFPVGGCERFGRRQGQGGREELAPALKHPGRRPSARSP